MRKYIKFLILLAVAILILWFFGRNLDWTQVRSILRSVDPFWLTAAFAVITLGYFVRAVRWQVLLKPITPASLRDLFATTTVGFAAVLIVGRAGEIVRPMWLPMRDKRVRPSAALATIFVERVFDLVSLISIFSLSLIWFKPPPGMEPEFASLKLAGNILLAIAVFGVLSLIFYHFKSAMLIGWFERVSDRRFVPKRLRAIFLSLMRQLAASLNILKSPSGIFWSAFWTLTLWLTIALPTWFVLKAFGLQMSFFDSTFVMGIASLGSLVPTPGGAAGAFHAATAGSLILLSVEREQAAAVSIIMHLVYFAPAVVFGLYYLFHGDISVERFRSLLSSENAEREIESDSPDFEPEG
ncbi:MAG: lysylphosphatidylglycerol synthase transmembrane domain-containing protein [Pyrinomonadaceae bacterium]